MDYQNILFDLDGTLTDPRVGITRSVQHALAQRGIDEPDLQALEHFIGSPLLQCFMQTYQFDEARAWRAVNHYHRFHPERGIGLVPQRLTATLAQLGAHFTGGQAKQHGGEELRRWHLALPVIGRAMTQLATRVDLDGQAPGAHGRHPLGQAFQAT